MMAWLLAMALGVPDAVQAARGRVEALDFRTSGRLIEVTGGQRTTSRFAAKGHWFPDGLHLLYEATRPGQPAQRVLLRMDPHGRVTVLQGAVALPAGLAYEDLVDSAFFWSGQGQEGASAVGGRSCVLVTSTPGTGEASRYAKAESCVDPASGMPLHVLKTLRGGGREEFAYGGVRQSGGVPVATETTVEMPAGGKVLLVIEHGNPHAHLLAKDFNMARAVEPVEDAPAGTGGR